VTRTEILSIFWGQAFDMYFLQKYFYFLFYGVFDFPSQSLAPALAEKRQTPDAKPQKKNQEKKWSRLVAKLVGGWVWGCLANARGARQFVLAGPRGL
jgi:hypothetical protein